MNEIPFGGMDEVWQFTEVEPREVSRKAPARRADAEGLRGRKKVSDIAAIT